MAYINAQQVAVKRAALKAAFPGWKFSVRMHHHSTIDVAILAAPVDFLNPAARPFSHHGYRTEAEYDAMLADQSARGNCDVNHYHVGSSWTGDQLEALTKVIEILMAGNHDRSDLMSDYHDVGWYVSLSIGEWRKPFQLQSAPQEIAA